MASSSIVASKSIKNLCDRTKLTIGPKTNYIDQAHMVLWIFCPLVYLIQAKRIWIKFISSYSHFFINSLINYMSNIEVVDVKSDFTFVFSYRNKMKKFFDIVEFC